MKAVRAAALALACVAGCARGDAEAGNPLSMVIGLLGDLQAKLIKAGEEAHAEYVEFADFCQDRAGEFSFEIEGSQADVEELAATIEEQKAAIAKLTERIATLAGDIAANEADLKKADDVRKEEHAAFLKEEAELTETRDAIKRAISVLEKELKGGASMLQLQHAGSLAKTLSVMVQASLIDTSDATQLTALVQASQGSDDTEDQAVGAPAAAAYEGQSGGIVSTLEDLLDKAESQLDETRNKEAKAKNDYEMLKQSVADELKFTGKDMETTKKGVAEATEKVSTAEGEMAIAKKEMAADLGAKKDLKHDCMTRAQSYELETNARDDELTVLFKAKKLINEAVGGASLSQVSFVQVALASGENLKRLKVLKLIRDLGHRENSTALAQLATRMASAMRNAGGADPFAKVRGMIEDMVTKLEDAAGADAAKAVFCKKELKDTKAQKDDMTDTIAALHTKNEQASARSAKLVAEIAQLQKDMMKIGKSQATLDKLRAKEKELFLHNKAEAEKGLDAVQKAMKVLKDYYSSKENADGGANAIIQILEDIASKMTAYLAELDADEEAAVVEYNTMSKENGIDMAAKEKDVSYDTKETKGLGKTIADFSSDEETTGEELDAVIAYRNKVKGECIAKPDTFEERKKRREAELAGLKQALEILGGDVALVQRRSRRRRLRGEEPHTLAALA